MIYRDSFWVKHMSINEVIFEKRGVDHEDERRAILTAFNGDLGDFKARSVGSVMPTTDMTIASEDKSTETLLYLLDGEASVMVASGIKPKLYPLEKGTRLLIPEGMKYLAEISKDSILVECSAQREPIAIGYQRLDLPEDFAAEQVKFAAMHKKAILGGHYHPDYGEYFSMIQGEANFTLGSLDSKETSEHHIAPGKGLLVVPNVPHKGVVSDGGILVGCTEKMYVSPDVNDVRYEF